MYMMKDIQQKQHCQSEIHKWWVGINGGSPPNPVDLVVGPTRNSGGLGGFGGNPLLIPNRYSEYI